MPDIKTLARMFHFGCRVRGDHGQTIVFNAGMAMAVLALRNDESAQWQALVYFGHAKRAARKAVMLGQFTPCNYVRGSKYL